MLNDLQRSETGKVIMAEDMKILLPSDLRQSQRSRGGVADGLAETEIRLRDAQCCDSLDGLRNQLLIKSQLLTYKHHNVRHQGMLTCSCTLLDRNDEKILLCVRRYQGAWEAKLRLVNGNLEEVRWKKLVISDVKLMQDIEETKKEMQKRRKRKRKCEAMEKGIVASEESIDDALLQDAVPGSTSRKVLSWIWTESGASGCLTDDALEDGELLL
ncbi:hypothetical protein C8J56DRAFT_784661 [Mycena floridula]|nr:hypothetical protein C8J56DRAFT_784661 [Mycena floridula]